MKTEDSGASAKGAGLELSDREKPGMTRKKVEIPAAVSYTHLTLPTIYSV